MNHESIKEKLFLYFDPETSDNERREINSHTDSCEECRLLLKRWEQIHNGLSKSPAPALSSPDFFTSRVMQRLDALENPAEEEKVPAKSFVPQWLLPTLGYAFAFMLMFAAISQREMPVNTEAILLNEIPQKSQWTFSAQTPEQPEMNSLMEM